MLCIPAKCLNEKDLSCQIGFARQLIMPTPSATAIHCDIYCARMRRASWNNREGLALNLITHAKLKRHLRGATRCECEAVRQKDLALEANGKRVMLNGAQVVQCPILATSIAVEIIEGVCRRNGISRG